MRLTRLAATALFTVSFLFTALPLHAQEGGRIVFTDPKSEDEVVSEDDLQPRRHTWGGDIMIGTDGFGVGFFYHYLFNDVVTGFANLSLSEAKDDRQRDYYNPWLGQYSPNKTHYVFRVPLFLGLQYRLFKEQIVDNFRPFVNAGAGPVMLYVSPAEPGGDFLGSLGGGKTHYTYGGFLGAGAQFGWDRSSVLGVNVRYFIIPAPAGISSVVVPDADAPNNERPVPLDNANGFYITLNFGTAF